MRALFCFFLFPFLIAAQPDTSHHEGTIKITKKYNEADHWPRIEGKLHGEISRAQLCAGSGIKTVYPYTIIGFTLKSSYIKDTSGIKSSNQFMSDDMCKVISSLPKGSTIHLEDIVAENQKGEKLRLNSLRFVIVGKDD